RAPWLLRSARAVPAPRVRHALCCEPPRSCHAPPSHRPSVCPRRRQDGSPSRLASHRITADHEPPRRAQWQPWRACCMILHVAHREELPMPEINKTKVVATLNKILEQELAGVVRYTHYSFLVYGYGRIPIVSWLRAQAAEGLAHAQQAGELITQLGAYPSLGIGPLLDAPQHDIGAILRESLDAERLALEQYRELLRLVEGRSVMLEEFARQMIYAEELHAGEVDKMLRKPGDVAAFKSE